MFAGVSLVCVVFFVFSIRYLSVGDVLLGWSFVRACMHVLCMYVVVGMRRYVMEYRIGSVVNDNDV